MCSAVCLVVKRIHSLPEEVIFVAVVWMFVPPPLPNSYVEILASKVMVLGGGAFERRLGYEGLNTCEWD